MQGHELLVEGGGLPVDSSFPPVFRALQEAGAEGAGAGLQSCLMDCRCAFLACNFSYRYNYLRIRLGLAGNNLGTFMAALLIAELSSKN
jgi:hypothetical protein